MSRPPNTYVCLHSTAVREVDSVWGKETEIITQIYHGPKCLAIPYDLRLLHSTKELSLQAGLIYLLPLIPRPQTYPRTRPALADPDETSTHSQRIQAHPCDMPPFVVPHFKLTSMSGWTLQPQAPSKYAGTQVSGQPRSPRLSPTTSKGQLLQPQASSRPL